MREIKGRSNEAENKIKGSNGTIKSNKNIKMGIRKE